MEEDRVGCLWNINVRIPPIEYIGIPQGPESAEGPYVHTCERQRSG